MTLLRVEGLTKSYVRKRNVFGQVIDRVEAVRDVSFSLGHGETLSIVGESGAGKSTVGRLILRLNEPDAGSVVQDGSDKHAMTRATLMAHR